MASSSSSPPNFPHPAPIPAAIPVASSSSCPPPTPKEVPIPMQSSSSSPSTKPQQAPACIVLGMAGSGKTTLVDALSAWLEDPTAVESLSNEEEITQLDGKSPPVDKQTSSANKQISPTDELTAPSAPTAPSRPENPLPVYVINLDPAVHSIPYEPNIDIRDNIKYKDVMKDYCLGPNGAIMTSLNLYATRFDQVLNLLEKRAYDVSAFLFDTPGQIETFTWSASGTIITEALAFSLPTVVLFVVDTDRSRSAMTFVSNMLYACSVMYKTNLPMVIVFNKVDITSCKFAQGWMEDFDAFDAALKEDNFVGTLARSMAMALEEFYKNMRSVGVSAITGEGLDELLDAIKEAAVDYEKHYRPALEEKKKLRKELQEENAKNQMDKFDEDRKDERDSKWAPKNAYDTDDEEEEEEYEETASSAVRNARLQKMNRLHHAPGESEDKKDLEELLKKMNSAKVEGSTEKSGSSS